ATQNHAEFGTSSTCSASTTGFCPSEDIARYSLKLRVIPMRLASATARKRYNFVQFVTPERVGLSHNRFGTETVLGQLRFYFFLLVWTFKPSLRQPFYCVIAIKPRFASPLRKHVGKYRS